MEKIHPRQEIHSTNSNSRMLTPNRDQMMLCYCICQLVQASDGHLIQFIQLQFYLGSRNQRRNHHHWNEQNHRILLRSESLKYSHVSVRLFNDNLFGEALTVSIVTNDGEKNEEIIETETQKKMLLKSERRKHDGTAGFVLKSWRTCHENIINETFWQLQRLHNIRLRTDYNLYLFHLPVLLFISQRLVCIRFADRKPGKGNLLTSREDSSENRRSWFLNLNWGRAKPVERR